MKTLGDLFPLHSNKSYSTELTIVVIIIIVVGIFVLINTYLQIDDLFAAPLELKFDRENENFNGIEIWVPILFTVLGALLGGGIFLTLRGLYG